MGLLNKLTTGQSQLTALNGTTPVTPNFQQSTLHKDYSIIGAPTSQQVLPPNGILPSPSQLDRQGEPVKYLNNLPG
jgi:hypothetical protein